MKNWDIFCRVIDNYGDIGVCWRLARQLAGEHNLKVRLWVDEIAALQAICPDATTVQQQTLAGVTVCIWSDKFQVDNVGDVIIEAFACHLPEVYIAAILPLRPVPIWLNLEYLSAEPWVEGCHQLSSIHPQNGLRKTFYFPGFSEKTGGLLRERELLLQRDSFINNDNEKYQFLTRVGVVAPAKNALLISLFGYENSALEGLMSEWSQSPVAVICVVPAGKILTSINSLLRTQLAAGDSFTRGALTFQVIPFLSQIDYDRLLWACDINFVRGEDSFVRAQWAAKPFVWHIYPQDDSAHLLKLNAFLARYTEAMNPQFADSLTLFWLAWNREDDCSLLWSNLFQSCQEWRKYSQLWSKHLALSPDLASNLVHFCQKIL